MAQLTPPSMDQSTPPSPPSMAQSTPPSMDESNPPSPPCIAQSTPPSMDESNPPSPPCMDPSTPPSMDDSSPPPKVSPMSVIAPEYCLPDPVELTLTSNLLTVTDDKGNIVFKVKPSMFSFSDKHVLIDPAGNHLVSMRQKIFSAHGRWEVYRGDSSSDKDYLFSVKNFEVFLASNTKEDVCDFKIKGSWSDLSCVVYRGESSDIVAKVHTKHSAESEVPGQDTFMVTVYPHVDYAFIVSLLVVLNEVEAVRRSMPSGG